MTRHPAGALFTTERAMSAGIGLFLAASVAKPRPNTLLSLLARGATGYCPMKAALAAPRYRRRAGAVPWRAAGASQSAVVRRAKKP